MIHKLSKDGMITKGWGTKLLSYCIPTGRNLRLRKSSAIIIALQANS